jgi:hypothetical protein
MQAAKQGDTLASWHQEGVFHNLRDLVNQLWQGILARASSSMLFFWCIVLAATFMWFYIGLSCTGGIECFMYLRSILDWPPYNSYAKLFAQIKPHLWRLAQALSYENKTPES